MHRITILAGVVSMVLGMSVSARAMQLFKLSDHPEGSLSPRDYGLRFDGAITTYTNLSFSVATPEGAPEMFVSVNDSGDEIHMFGKASYGSHLYDIDFTYNTNVHVLIDGWMVQPGGSTPTENHGTIIGPGLNGLAFFDKENTQRISFVLRADGHRLPGDNSTWVGRGWVTTSASHGMTPGTHDWLFIATPVDELPSAPGSAGIPEPATAGMGLLGMGLLATWTRRRRRLS